MIKNGSTSLAVYYIDDIVMQLHTQEHKMALMTAKQVAARLCVSDKMVYKMLKLGWFDSVRVGTSVRIPEDSVQRYVTNHFKEATHK